MSHVLTRIGKNIAHSVRKVDLYGKSISIMYRGDDKFKTYLGGIASVIIFLFLVIYSSFLLDVMRKKSTIIFNTTAVIRDLTKDFTNHYLAKHEFAFAVEWTGSMNNLLHPDDNSIVELEIYQHVDTAIGNGKFSSSKVKLDYELCGNKFPYFNQTLINHFGIKDYMCVKAKDYFIGGNIYSDKNSYIEIILKKCTSRGESCASDEDIKDRVDDTELDIIMIDGYFDLNNFKTPIGHFLTEKFHYSIIPGFEKISSVYIKENKLELQDNYLQYSGAKKNTFYSVAESTDDLRATTDSEYVRVYLKLDPERRQYKRTVYSLLDLIAQLGGVFSVIQSIFTFILGMYADRVFFHSVLSK